MKKLLIILLMPIIGFGQCIKGDCENGVGLYFMARWVLYKWFMEKWKSS